jgi:hypothetical protein
MNPTGEIENPPNGGWCVVPMFQRIPAKGLSHGGNVFRWLFEKAYGAAMYRLNTTRGVTCAVRLI